MGLGRTRCWASSVESIREGRVGARGRGGAYHTGDIPLLRPVTGAIRGRKRTSRTSLRHISGGSSSSGGGLSPVTGKGGG